MNQKIEILYQLNRNEEAQETIQKHLYLPNIREARVQILAIYSEKIQVYAEKNMGRQHYQYVASILKEILKFKGGKDVVDTLVKKIRIQYKRRPAMMEILRDF